MTGPPRAEMHRKTFELLRKAGIRLRKRLGQHFITDVNLLRNIAGLMVPDPSFSALEVGAGAGTLTRELSKVARQVVAIEIDVRLREVALQTVPEVGERVRWIWGDVLEIDLDQLVRKLSDPSASKWVLCGNLPYYLTSELLYRVLIPRTSFRRVAFVVQKEVAERMASAPGTRNFGRLSLWCQYRGTVRILRSVPKRAFVPPPDVDSSLVALDVHPSFPLEPAEESCLDTISRLAFSHRRKTLFNALRSLPVCGDVLLGVLERSGVRPEARPEQIPVQQYVLLAQFLSPMISGPGGSSEGLQANTVPSG